MINDYSVYHRMLQTVAPIAGSANPCAAELMAVDIKTIINHQATTEPINYKDMVLIWGTRSTINIEKGRPAKGLDEMIDRLRSTPVSGIMVHGIDTAEKSFMVFIDADNTICFGVICLDK